jgi:hypothetical protein
MQPGAGRISSRIVFEPVEGENGAPMYPLRMPISYEQILERVVPGLQVSVASPTGNTQLAAAVLPLLRGRVLRRAA